MQSLTNATPRIDAIEILKADHQMVRKLFSTYEKLCDADLHTAEKGVLVTQLCSALTVHAQIEEEIFYPALREALDADDLLDEAEFEHAAGKDLVPQLESMSSYESLFDATVAVLGEYINHHLDEEEGKMFDQAKDADLDIVTLGEELSERRDELRAQLDLDVSSDAEDDDDDPHSEFNRDDNTAPTSIGRSVTT